MKPNPVVLRLTLAAARLAAQAANATVNLIDQTWGAGVGSFEPGVFAPRSVGNDNFQSLLAGSSVLTGWQVGGVGLAHEGVRALFNAAQAEGACTSPRNALRSAR